MGSYAEFIKKSRQHGVRKRYLYRCLQLIRHVYPNVDGNDNYLYVPLYVIFVLYGPAEDLRALKFSFGKSKLDK